MVPELVATFDEAVGALKVSKRTVERLVATRQLGSFKIGADVSSPSTPSENFTPVR